MSAITLAGLSLMVMQLVTSLATKWGGSFQGDAAPRDPTTYLHVHNQRIETLSWTLSKRIHPWRCYFTKREQAYIMWAVHEGTNALTCVHSDKIAAFKLDIKNTHRLQA